MVREARAELQSVRVGSQQRGRGPAEQLVTCVVDLVRAEAAPAVQLTTNATRTDARRFYRRLGFGETHIGMKLFLEER